MPVVIMPAFHPTEYFLVGLRPGGLTMDGRCSTSNLKSQCGAALPSCGRRCWWLSGPVALCESWCPLTQSGRITGGAGGMALGKTAYAFQYAFCMPYGGGGDTKNL